MKTVTVQAGDEGCVRVVERRPEVVTCVLPASHQPCAGACWACAGRAAQRSATTESSSSLRSIRYNPPLMAPKRKPIIERFLWKFKVDTQTGCWIWTGAKAGDDYSYLFLREAKHLDGLVYNVYKYGHVASYELFIGPIPEGKEIHHKCRVHACVNPHHLEALTHRENMLLDDTIVSRNLS